MAKHKAEPVIDPALEFASGNSPAAQAQKKAAVQTLTELRRTSAWALSRYPLHRHVYLGNRAKIHLPRSYLANEGEDVWHVNAGTDLNLVVFEWYNMGVDPASDDSHSRGVNYVDRGGVVMKRHEFMGPSPHVAGYFVDVDEDIYVKWWDSFLGDQWMGPQKWNVEVVWNGERWIEKA